MKLTIYHLKSCDKCRKAIKCLNGAGYELDVIDVRADGVSQNKLDEMLDSLGYEVLLNTRSTTWRGLSEGEKSDMERGKARALLLAHPTLMKRPVIYDGAQYFAGWTKAVEDRLKSSSRL